jgi:integrase
MSTNHFINLLAQAEKLRRHNRQGSYKTKERYFEAYKRFLRFAGDVFRLEKISNISGKHMSGYVEHMKNNGNTPSTIKTDLAAIRFWHDQLPNAKYVLPINAEYDLERRKFGGVDRTWSDDELNRMIRECREAGRDDYEACITVARYAALRLHEVMRIDTAIAHAAIRNGFITIKGKGGKIRDVPINETIRTQLEKYLLKTAPGHKLFVSDYKQTHIAMTELQNFINAHRKNTQDGGSTRPLSFHGLRHTCAAEWYGKLIDEGMDNYQARLQVSKWLGHERDDVTRIYLASLDKGGGCDV